MRLEKIKLAGFKSFVDPTNVPLTSNLVGIVGPNGCGKSNVIDAVRWVMGESSAKMLRGESMADVIFNGSNSRKPVGTASIELVFENSDGGAGGQYAQYAQISVRRLLSRDGQSNYYINGVRCRRRDITGLFLGTGLGPRSYSIIEQGMISRLIEARPEDLRAFLEEAAGISKYKERRKETESRIARTRENLSRLNDLREEVEKLLQRLNRQAATAERYKKYKEQERRLKAELLALRWQMLDAAIQQHDRDIVEHETLLEAAVAGQRRLEAEIEKAREMHADANDDFNQVQERFYAVGSEITKHEQAIQYARQTRFQQEQELNQAEQAWQEATEHQRQDATRLSELKSILEEEEPKLALAKEEEQHCMELLAGAEQTMHSWQSDWERFNREAAEPAQTAQVERTKINHLEQQAQNLQHRFDKHRNELVRLEDPALNRQIDELAQNEAAVQDETTELQRQLADCNERITALRAHNADKSLALNEARARLQTGHGRLTSLEALQQAALGKDKGLITTQWLAQRGLNAAARVAESIEVEPGWRLAVETVLGFHLQAVCIEGLDPVATEIGSLEKGALSLFDRSETRFSAAPKATALIHKIRSPLRLESLLQGVQTADDLSTALTLRSRLLPGETIITRDGVWLGSNWLRLDRESDEKGSVLGREQEIRELQAQMRDLELRVESLVAAVEAGQEEQQAAEDAREQCQQALDEVNRRLSEIRTTLGSKRTRAEHLHNRRHHIQKEMDDLESLQQQGQTELEHAHSRLHAALEEMESLSMRREALISRKDQVRAELDEIRQLADRQRNETHAMALQVESMRASRESLSRSLDRMEGQLLHLAERRNELKQVLAAGEEPMREQARSLEVQLALRIEVEAELALARKRLEVLESDLRRLEQERAQAEQKVQRQRTALDQLRMQRQEVLIRAKTIDEQLDASGFQRQLLLQEMAQDSTAEAWEQEVERMDNRIHRLGPINLAAIDEHKEQSERMNYLNTQYNDVTESLETLENVIRKIDRETRTRFQETYDKVNSGLQEKFPLLFGGGHAYLQLTGEDLLDTGVTVMARPPGKRISSIHLLSGGEKALTAVALVFAIFELNPAPFCMLDEVDAPLDDANVGRYCELVKSMSERVQFIFITHNKITMEIANQLTGVTMHEPGVSRLVSVDVDEAVQMAAL